MKRIFFLPFLAALLIGCADSGVGSAADSERGTDQFSERVPPSDPGVATEPSGTPPQPTTADSAYNSAIGSSVAPSVPAPVQGSTNSPGVREPNSYEERILNERPLQQGDQTTSEPLTGDDANPADADPRER